MTTKHQEQPWLEWAIHPDLSQPQERNFPAYSAISTAILPLTAGRLLTHKNASRSSEDAAPHVAVHTTTTLSVRPKGPAKSKTQNKLSVVNATTPACMSTSKTRKPDAIIKGHTNNRGGLTEVHPSNKGSPIRLNPDNKEPEDNNMDPTGATQGVHQAQAQHQPSSGLYRAK